MRAQTNKTFESFTRHVVRDVWERDFGCARTSHLLERLQGMRHAASAGVSALL